MLQLKTVIYKVGLSASAFGSHVKAWIMPNFGFGDLMKVLLNPNNDGALWLRSFSQIKVLLKMME